MSLERVPDRPPWVTFVHQWESRGEIGYGESVSFRADEVIAVTTAPDPGSFIGGKPTHEVLVHLKGSQPVQVGSWPEATEAMAWAAVIREAVDEALG